MKPVPTAPAPGTVLGLAWAVSVGGEYTYIYESEWTYGMAGHGKDEPAETVELVADPEGGYLGWLDTEEGNATPILVRHREFFPMQFPYGVRAEVDAGKGIAVALALRPLPGTTE